MIDISVSLLSKFYGDNQILKDVSFNINAGEKVGIIGANGAGKTTLFKILAGEISFDAGSVATPPGKRVGILSQLPVYPQADTVEDVLRRAFEELFSLRGEMKSLELMMQRDHSRETLFKYDRAAEAYRLRGGYERDVETDKVCNGLQISADMRRRPFAGLSGGEQTRVNLARIILEKTDILLLDEPTNHLDMSCIEWLEGFLKGYAGTVLTISHDRYFLDTAVDRIIEIEDKKAHFYSGNYSFYLAEKRGRAQLRLKQYERQQQKIEDMEKAVRRMRTWAESNTNLYRRAFAMESRLNRIERPERPRARKSIRSSFNQDEYRGDTLFCAKDISKAYGEKEIFSGLSLEILPGQRVAVIGDNGAGKTTLLEVMTGAARPDAGAVKWAPSVKRAYFAQKIAFDHADKSLTDCLIYETGCTPQAARDRLAAYMFTGDDALKRVHELSGGEKSRLKLCLLMAGNINTLILDEPTNHLDMPSREWIEGALSDFEGTIIFVSHDRYFIDKFATRILWFEGGKINDFAGGYAQFKKRFEAAPPAREAAEKPPPKAKPAGRKGRDAAKKLAVLEREIALCEERALCTGRLMESCASDFERLSELMAEKTEIEDKITALYNEWYDLSSDPD